MELYDGNTTRSVIREDKKTYHEGHLLETFGSLESVDIPMGIEYTDLEVTLTDSGDMSWTVCTCWDRVQDVFTCSVTSVRCSPERFDYLHQQARGGDVWTAGQNKYDLMNVITPEM